MQNQYITDTQSRFELPAKALQNKVIVISGATGGLGTPLSKACATAGATVVLLGRKLKKLEALYDVLDSLGPATPALITLDQATALPESYLELGQMLTSEFGQLDGLLHCATELGVLTPLQSLQQTDWARVIAVNLTSARLLSNACLPLLDRSGNASVVFTLDQKASAYWGAYGVSKAGVKTLMQTYADETDGRKNAQGHCKVAFNAIDPGPMRTPLRRQAFPGELESETPAPETKLGPFLSLLTRSDPALTGRTFVDNE
ncbi:MAG: SDR family NAD(P)-dependent oxidoreductase [Granulosicoccaceae bacterium]